MPASLESSKTAGFRRIFREFQMVRDLHIHHQQRDSFYRGKVMSLVESGDLDQHLHSARSWMKESAPPRLKNPGLLNRPKLQDGPTLHGGPGPLGIAGQRPNTAVEAPAAKFTKPARPKPEALANEDGQKPAKQTTRTKAGPLSGNAQAIAAGQYDRMIEDMIRNESQIEITQHVIRIERSEVTALVKQIARTKGRYLATLLESAKGKNVSSSRIEDLRQLRDTHYELQQGLNDLRRHILDGTVTIEGIRN
jgi:hypothetical protein